MAGKGVAVSPGFFITSKNGGGTTVPGGVNQDIQFNDNGVFGGEHSDGISIPGMTWDKVLKSVCLLSGPGGLAQFQGGATGSAALQIDDTGSPTDVELVNLETGGTLNIKADGAINIESDGAQVTVQSDSHQLQLTGGSGITAQASAGDIDLTSVAGKINLVSQSDTKIAATANAIIDGGNAVAIQNGGVISLVSEVSTGSPKLGFFGANTAFQPIVVGSRTTGVALQNLLTALALLGLIVDNTTP